MSSFRVDRLAVLGAGSILFASISVKKNSEGRRHESINQEECQVEQIPQSRILLFAGIHPCYAYSSHSNFSTLMDKCLKKDFANTLLVRFWIFDTFVRKSKNQTSQFDKW